VTERSARHVDAANRHEHAAERHKEAAEYWEAKVIASGLNFSANSQSTNVGAQS